MVELGTVGDPGAVPDAVATTLGIAPQGDAPMTETIAETLAGRRVLLLLDNCEHVLDEASSSSQALLAQRTS